MNYELALQLKEEGFPSITRWEVENNIHRILTVSGEPSMPCFEAIVSEIKDFGGVVKVKNSGRGKSEINGFYAFQEVLYPYGDGMTQLYPPDDQEEMSETPRDAVAKLWLNIHSVEPTPPSKKEE